MWQNIFQAENTKFSEHNCQIQPHWSACHHYPIHLAMQAWSSLSLLSSTTTVSKATTCTKDNCASEGRATSRLVQRNKWNVCLFWNYSFSRNHFLKNCLIFLSLIGSWKWKFLFSYFAWHDVKLFFEKFSKKQPLKNVIFLNRIFC